jgi:hypothetical protein
VGPRKAGVALIVRYGGGTRLLKDPVRAISGSGTPDVAPLEIVAQIFVPTTLDGLQIAFV